MNNPTTTPESVFKEMGLRYVGLQEMPHGRPSAYMFDAKDGSTLMMDGPVNPETINQKLAEHEAICKEFLK